MRPWKKRRNTSTMLFLIVIDALFLLLFGVSMGKQMVKVRWRARSTCFARRGGHLPAAHHQRAQGPPAFLVRKKLKRLVDPTRDHPSRSARPFSARRAGPRAGTGARRRAQDAQAPQLDRRGRRRRRRRAVRRSRRPTSAVAAAPCRTRARRSPRFIRFVMFIIVMSRGNGSSSRTRSRSSRSRPSSSSRRSTACSAGSRSSSASSPASRSSRGALLRPPPRNRRTSRTTATTEDDDDAPGDAEAPGAAPRRAQVLADVIEADCATPNSACRDHAQADGRRHLRRRAHASAPRSRSGCAPSSRAPRRACGSTTRRSPNFAVRSQIADFREERDRALNAVTGALAVEDSAIRALEHAPTASALNTLDAALAREELATTASPCDNERSTATRSARSTPRSRATSSTSARSALRARRATKKWSPAGSKPSSSSERARAALGSGCTTKRNGCIWRPARKTTGFHVATPRTSRNSRRSLAPLHGRQQRRPRARARWAGFL